jgi:hypothetical protein
MQWYTPGEAGVAQTGLTEAEATLGKSATAPVTEATTNSPPPALFRRSDGLRPQSRFSIPTPQRS